MSARSTDTDEGVALPEDDNNELGNQVRDLRVYVADQLRVQAEQLQRLEEGFKQIRGEHERIALEVVDKLEALKSSKLSSPSSASEGVLGAARNVFTATSAKQALNILSEESSRLGVRAAAFEVRGEAAWAAAAYGFGDELGEQTLRSLVVPLSVDTPFRRVFERGEAAGGMSDLLKQNPNVLARLKPQPNSLILLLPIRSAGAVSAIFYVDSGASGGPLPEAALGLLAELAGAQLDRLAMLRSRGRSGESENGVGRVQTEWAVSLRPPEVAESGDHPAASQAAVGVAPDSGLGTGFDESQLSPAEQQTHLEARRLARLLVSEIELYNKAEIIEGRQSKDLYRRLKLDIERSRQTYARRFGPKVGKQLDYFQDELVRTLAGNDPSLLGSNGPAV